MIDGDHPHPREAAVSVIGNFRQVAKAERLNIHPLVVRSLPDEAAERLRAAQAERPNGSSNG